MRADDPRHPRPRPQKKRGPVDWIFSRAIAVLWIAFFGFLLSLLVEWVGMTFWWPEEGAQHSYRMLQTELGYLDRDFKESIIGTTPAEIALDVSGVTYRYTGVEWLVGWLTGPVMRGEVPFASHIQAGVAPLIAYIEATAYITQLYGVRLAVVVLSMGAFGLFGVVALVSGLAQRDLRRFGGGVESAWIFHRLTPFLPPTVWVAVMLYLSTPFSLHPNWVFLPAAATFALVTSKTTARFKKFL